MSHGHGDMKIVSSDGKLLDYYKDILRCVSTQNTMTHFKFPFKDTLTTTAMF